MRNYFSQLLAGSLVAMLTATLCSTALAQHGDILLTIDDVTGKVETGAIANQTNILELEGTRVYEVELDDPGVFGLGQPFSGAEPGMVGVDPGVNISPNLALPANQDMNFSFKNFTIPGKGSGNLWHWDFTGVDPTTVTPADVDFQSPAAGHTMTLAELNSGIPNASVDGAATDVAGFAIGMTDGNGGFHEDLENSVGNGGGEPDPGIYLYSLEFEIDGNTSEPVFLLGATIGVDFNSEPPFDFTNVNINDPMELEEGFESLIEAAEEWVENNLVNNSSTNAVPEPSTLLLTMMGGLAGLLLTRRQWRKRSSI